MAAPNLCTSAECRVITDIHLRSIYAVNNDVELRYWEDGDCVVDINEAAKGRQNEAHP
jgi:hypothetical protein